mmetsp:Transcript_37522/g.60797  ORF Transcript_37522/g.60797 Transcript_37522/m.60797 type:complete len:326 (+) Transcript_37522:43-1020(+)
MYRFIYPAVCLARAPKHTWGKPGSWLKYHDGSFSQPGIGGKCSNIPNLKSEAVTKMIPVNDPKPLFVAINSAGGLPLSISYDLLNWNVTNGYTLPYLNGRLIYNHFWRSYFCFYTSIIEEAPGKYWMYTAYLSPAHKQGFDNRNIVRYPISITVNPEPVCGTKLALVRYRNITGSDVWVTVQPVDERVWRLDRILGYVYNCLSPCIGCSNSSSLFRVILYDCGSSQPEMVNVSAMDPINFKTKRWIGSHKECDPSKGVAPDGSGDLVLPFGMIGYVSDEPRPNMGPLFRCLSVSSSSRRSYDVSVNQPCPVGTAIQTLLGYIALS